MMELTAFYTSVIGFVLLAGVIIDQAYQRLSHRWTNEPPLLPYRIPIVGHVLMFRSDCLALFKAAQYVEFITN
jgi:hypothetical protein